MPLLGIAKPGATPRSPRPDRDVIFRLRAGVLCLLLSGRLLCLLGPVELGAVNPLPTEDNRQFLSYSHLCLRVLEPRDKGLIGTTLRYPYEVRDTMEYFDDVSA